MQVNLKLLEQTLGQAEQLYLSTSLNDVVSARPVSPLNIGLRLFVRTSSTTRKATEMLANPNFAGCVGRFYFTGRAKSLGPVFDSQNAHIKSAYAARYPGAFSAEDEFIKSDEIFFELTLRHVSEWVYENGVPVGLAQQELPL